MNKKQRKRIEKARRHTKHVQKVIAKVDKAVERGELYRAVVPPREKSAMEQLLDDFGQGFSGLPS